jgi:hypothetical protein
MDDSTIPGVHFVRTRAPRFVFQSARPSGWGLQSILRHFTTRTTFMSLWEIHLFLSIQNPTPEQEDEFRQLCDSMPVNVYGCPDSPPFGTPNVKAFNLHLFCDGPNNQATHTLMSSRCMMGTKEDAKKQENIDKIFFEENGFLIHRANIEPQTHSSNNPRKPCVNLPLAGNSDGLERWNIRCEERHMCSPGWI